MIAQSKDGKLYEIESRPSAGLLSEKPIEKPKENARVGSVKKGVGIAMLAGGVIVAALGVTDYLGITRNVTNLGGAWTIVGGPTCPTGQNCGSAQWLSWNEIAFLGIGGSIAAVGAVLLVS